MSPKPILLLLLICLTTLKSVDSRSREKDGRRRNDRISSSPSSSIDGPIDKTEFCVRHRDMKLMCYCTPNIINFPVQKAECWVLSNNLLLNDTAWTKFNQQKDLREFKLVTQHHFRFDYIPTNIFKSLENLTSISIEYSQVDIVRSYAFANLRNLESIILTNNQILVLEKEAFANHIRLRDLDLQNNKIFKIDRKTFFNLPMCERLNLKNNSISILHDGIFCNIMRMLYLNLANNQITVLTTEVFKGLSNLNVLQLSHNNICYLGDNVFTELWSLKELELDNNKIELISERAFDGLNNLKTLNLGSNLLKTLDDGLFHGTPALLLLNVQSNNLQTLSLSTFQPIMDNLVNKSAELILHDNNYICDCNFQWLYDLKMHTRNPHLRDSLEHFVCSLIDPQLENFLEPIPNNIMQLLTMNGLNAPLTSDGRLESSSNTNRKRPSKTHQGTQIQLTEEGHEQELAYSSSLKEQYQRTMSSSSSSAPVESHYIFDGPVNSNRIHNEHFDHNAPVGLTDSTQIEDELDSMKKDALFDEKKLTPQKSSSNKQTFLIQVHLFTLNRKYLPCFLDMNIFTEIPLSRDLKDALSSKTNNFDTAGKCSNTEFFINILLLLTSAMVYTALIG